MCVRVCVFLRTEKNLVFRFSDFLFFSRSHHPHFVSIRSFPISSREIARESTCFLFSIVILSTSVVSKGAGEKEPLRRTKKVKIRREEKATFVLSTPPTLSTPQRDSRENKSSRAVARPLPRRPL